MNNQKIDLHTSEIVSIYAYAASSIVFIRAYLYEPGEKKGAGWLQRTEVIITGVSYEPEDMNYPCEVIGGSIHTALLTHNDLIPVPFAYSGAATFKLNCIDADGRPRQIEYSGSGIQVVPRGEAVYVEVFPGLY